MNISLARLAPPALLALLALITALSPLCWPTAANASESALVVEAGSVARQQLVALGRDLVVRGEALEGVAAVNGSVRVEGRVEGDVVVLGGDVTLSDQARVGGDIFVLGGRLSAEAGSSIGGRSVSYPSVGAAWLVLLEGPSLGLAPLSPTILGVKLALLAAWMLLATVIIVTSGREVVSASAAVSGEPFRMFLVGLGAVLCLFLTALFVSAWSSSVLGVPLLFLVVLLAVVLKLWGSVAVFHAAGLFLSRRFKRRFSPVNAAVVGLLVLGALKLVPWVGVWVWTIVTLLGVGTALGTKFGRREPWFEPVLPPSLGHS